MATLVDGRAIAMEWKGFLWDAVSSLVLPPRLMILQAGDDPATRSFVTLKQRIAGELGVEVVVERTTDLVSTEELVQLVRLAAEDDLVDGIVVQLPLPSSVDTESVLSAIPVEKDVDVLSRESMARFRKGELPIVPPVALAVQDICTRFELDLDGAEVLVLGHGRLVGAPVALWLRHNGALVTVVDQPVANLELFTREAELIVSGTGVPGLLRPEGLSEGVVLIDAGTSESEGKLVGDVDPSCAEVASLMTPVPGGVGPITVMMLFRNLLVLTVRRRGGESAILTRVTSTTP